MSKLTGVFLAASLVALLGSIPGAAAEPPPRLSEYQLLRQIPRARLDALMGEQPDAKGFTGSNHVGGYWIEVGPQRGSCRGLIAAVVLGDLARADDAWRGIETAFAHQRADGGFEAGDRPDGTSARPFGAAVETAFFFLQELGRAILVIRESPHAAHFHDRISALEPRIRSAAAFITSGYDEIIKESSAYVNRIVIAAKAFGTCGVVLGDEKLMALSRKLISHALTLRDQDGVFIEGGGRDSSYNVVSILFGTVLGLHLPIPEFEAALPAAMAWELTRIKPSGEVDATGNTRTGVAKEVLYFGQAKVVNYSEVVQALTLYGLIHDDRACLVAADRVFEYLRSHPKQKDKSK